MTESLYGQMGVDAHKGTVESAFEGKIDNNFPHAFVNATRDKKAPGYVKTLKVDGDGSRPTQHVLHFMETGDETSFEPSADDSHAMVATDAGAAGFIDEYTFADVLDVNKLAIPGRKDLKEMILYAYSKRISEVIALHREYGFDEEFLGGETADLPSQTSSYICNGVLQARVHESCFIDGVTMPGDKIWGFSSGGKSRWEKKSTLV
ncbi:MAG: hypothetical protein US30_C0008G0030 [Candidatus Moranbacteria bacterium GW2011_GWF2_36_839]|nr:MAG: hypothetical protein US27_C0008G0030 [Candidatus Moranbacteria bacterium GW2011_GWF1_36_78]KKQ17012.1 MAG: hypothetical protein US30_C0008G0030 [Candidatus Moranbacteria bacterium GW2011_GWF2_36_839]HAT74024.1 hypothetical protein [Candidatus Moranbacteria bacterium]HBY11188.1 hypothetical protein [Candidatus Moranbacteria bacterium]